MKHTKICLGFLITAVVVSAWADVGDPPSRVARLNFINGPVSFRPGTVEEWTGATVNYPLTTGDHLWADNGGRAELHVGSTAIRMDSMTAISILNLDDRVLQLSVTAGAVNVHVQYLGPEESIEVDTPNAGISLLRVGDYRITADGDNSVTLAVVRAGQAEFSGGGQAFPIRAGESARITGTDTISQQMGPAPPADEFDQFCMTRDRREVSSMSARYVPRETIGYEDLDQYGVWREVPPYGMVWTPTAVPVGWAPYHTGRWAWVEPWGWTWIDEAPWGFAPFHYGRWAFAGGAWVWAPGRMVVGVRPVYAPALVAFVGGPRFGVALGVGGGVGVAAWFPLGPGEVFRPAYHVSPAYVTSVNIVHVSNVTMINSVSVTNVRYMNQGVNGAVMAVPAGSFAGRPVASVAVVVPRGAVAQATVVGMTAGVPPTREAVLVRGGPAAMAVHAPPARIVERTVVVRNAPPAPPVSFAAREQALRANGGRPLEPAQMAQFKGSTPGRNPMVRNAGAPAGGGPGGAMRPETARPNMPARNDRPPNAYGGQTFGQPRTNGPPAQARPSETTRPGAETARPSETTRPGVETARPNSNERPARGSSTQQQKKNNKKTERQERQ